MASSNNGDEPHQTELGKTLKEGERIIAPTRRPDGTLRKARLIRAGYTPQDEVAIYKSKGSLLKKEMIAQGPPGYDPTPETKPKTKSVKRNEKKKEKRIQAALERGKNTEQADSEENDHIICESEVAHSLASQMNELAVTENPAGVLPPSDSMEFSNQADPIQDIDKRIRALKKKIRLTEAQKEKTAPQEMQAEQLEKFAKVESWQDELKLLEERRAQLAES